MVFSGDHDIFSSATEILVKYGLQGIRSPLSGRPANAARRPFRKFSADSPRRPAGLSALTPRHDPNPTRNRDLSRSPTRDHAFGQRPHPQVAGGFGGSPCDVLLRARRIQRSCCRPDPRRRCRKGRVGSFPSPRRMIPPSHRAPGSPRVVFFGVIRRVRRASPAGQGPARKEWPQAFRRRKPQAPSRSFAQGRRQATSAATSPR